jgi:hypothetical protein
MLCPVRLQVPACSAARSGSVSLPAHWSPIQLARLNGCQTRLLQFSHHSQGPIRTWRLIYWHVTCRPSEICSEARPARRVGVAQKVHRNPLR